MAEIVLRTRLLASSPSIRERGLPVIYQARYETRDASISVYQPFDGLYKGKVGTWYFKTLQQNKRDILHIDAGQDWSVSGILRLLEEIEELSVTRTDPEAFRERLLEIYNLDFRTFSKVFYDKDCPDLDHIEPYLREKYGRFLENPLGLVLELDSKGFRRVYEFLMKESTNA